MLAHQLGAQHLPQQAERRVGHAVGASLAGLLVVVEHAAADIIDDAVEIIGHHKAARDLDVRPHNLQQGGGEHVIRVEFAPVGKAFCRYFHGSLLRLIYRQFVGADAHHPPAGRCRHRPL